MKRGLEELFGQVAWRYELINHVLTFGLDIAWRRKAARLATKGGGSLWLDVCSGTGEMARSLYRESRRSSHPVKIVCLDFCPAMFDEFRRIGQTSSFLLVLAEAGMLPFPDGVFDAVMIAFATRNIHTMREALVHCLKEFHRVLRPGGRFINLETSQPRSHLLQKVFHAYLRVTVKPIGHLLSGSRPAFAYLAESIRRFYSSSEFGRLLEAAGFSRVEERPLFWGAAAIHLAFKK